MLSLRELQFEGYEITDHRDSYMRYDDPDDGAGTEQWVGGTAITFNLDLLKRGDWGAYWDNRVDGKGTDSQMREVSWRWEAGLQLGPDFQVFSHHHSRHVMDAARIDEFPLDNWYGARLTLYRRP